MLKYTFDNRENLFFKQLKQRVDNYFAEYKLHRAGNNKLYWKSVVQVFSALSLYILLVFFTPSVLVAIPLCFSFL